MGVVCVTAVGFAGDTGEEVHRALAKGDHRRFRQIVERVVNKGIFVQKHRPEFWMQYVEPDEMRDALIWWFTKANIDGENNVWRNGDTGIVWLYKRDMEIFLGCARKWRRSGGGLAWPARILFRTVESAFDVLQLQKKPLLVVHFRIVGGSRTGRLADARLRVGKVLCLTGTLP